MATTRPTAIPAHADVSQDIAGPLPASLLRDWSAGERTLERAISLLAPFRREGTVGASDASGLSKLSQERDLLEVVWMVAQPKQILHGIGTAIGGEAIGTWIADNTEMFYPETIPVDDVVAAMIETQARIAERASVMIGICLHSGVFYEIGGGLYGADAHAVEILAEDHAAASELLVTSEIHASLRDPGAATFERRDDLDVVHAPGVYRVRSSRRFAALAEDARVYPHGFPPDFYATLGPARENEPRTVLGNEPRTVEKFVVFLVRARTAHGDGDLPAILDDFVADALMRTVVADSAGQDGHVAQMGGGFAVVVFAAGQPAFEFAKLARERLGSEGVAVKIGIDCGPVLLFTGTGIVGDPVNLASKISEDMGQAGRISITDRAAAGIAGLPRSERFGAEISRVRVSGVVV